MKWPVYRQRGKRPSLRPELADNRKRLKKLYHSKYKNNPEYKKKVQEWRLKKYGLTLEQYNNILIHQNGVCAICKRPPGKRRLSVDHCHKTGKVRGLLCFHCNYGLSWFNDDPSRLRAAASHVDVV